MTEISRDDFNKMLDEELEKTLVGKQADSQRRNERATSLKKLHVLANGLRDRGYPVSFEENNGGYAISMLYAGNTAMLITKEGERYPSVDNRWNYPVNARMTREDFKTDVPSLQKKEGIAIENRDKIIEKAKHDLSNSTDISEVTLARETLAERREYDDALSQKQSTITKQKSALRRNLSRIEKALSQNKHDAMPLKLHNDEEFLTAVVNVVKVWKETEEKGLFVVSSKKIDESSKTVTYEREVLGSLYDPNVITVQEKMYPKLNM